MRNTVWHSKLITSIDMPFANLTAFQTFVSLCKNLPLENLCVRTPFYETTETLRPLCKELFEHQTRLKHLTVATFGEHVPDLLPELTRLRSLVLDLDGSIMNNNLSEVIPPSLSNLTSLTIINPSNLGQHRKTSTRNTNAFKHITNSFA